jgi:glycosyltransferase involved in cell wall biosynthesis
VRTLQLITGLGVGGAEQQLRLLLRHLPADCDVATLTNPGPVADGIRADGTRVIDLGMRGNRDLTVLPRLAGLIRTGGYDLVHTHLYRACVYGRTAARLAGVRAVATEHSLGDGQIEGRPLSPGNRALYLATERFGRATVAVSATVAARLRAWGVPDRRIHVVPNGIDARRFRFDPAARAAARARLGVPPDAVVIGGVGRLVSGKRFGTLLRACPSQPYVRLLLVGDGPERDSLRRLATHLGLGDRLLLPGECAGTDGTPTGAGPRPLQLPELLSAMDLFAAPSTQEAFGLSVLEALASGLPVLYGACPAVDEAPHAEAPGARHVGPGTEALSGALQDHLAAGIRRLPVPRVVERYDIAHSADGLMSVYERVLARPRRHSVGTPRAARTERTVRSERTAQSRRTVRDGRAVRAERAARAEVAVPGAPGASQTIDTAER